MMFSITGVFKNLQCAIEVYTIDLADVLGPTVVADCFIRMLQITGFIDGLFAENTFGGKYEIIFTKLNKSSFLLSFIKIVHVNSCSRVNCVDVYVTHANVGHDDHPATHHPNTQAVVPIMGTHSLALSVQHS